MSTTMNKTLQRFLDSADECYIEAYQTRRYGLLIGKFTKEAMTAINFSVLNNGESRYFAEKHYRQNNWEILEESEDGLVIQKTQVFKSIHISLFKTMKASRDYTEEWVVKEDPNSKSGYIVSSIGRMRYIA